MRGAAHLALAHRGSRVAVYDLRESFDRAGEPLPADFLAAAARVGDDSCLEPMARAWAGSRNEPWWRSRLMEAASDIVSRLKLTGRHATMRRIRDQMARVRLSLARRGRCGLGLAGTALRRRAPRPDRSTPRSSTASRTRPSPTTSAPPTIPWRGLGASWRRARPRSSTTRLGLPARAAARAGHRRRHPARRVLEDQPAGARHQPAQSRARSSSTTAWRWRGPRGGFVEIAAQDPVAGRRVLHARPARGRRRRVTAPVSCLTCHVSYATLNVPGLLVRSVGHGAGRPLAHLPGQRHA